MHSDEIQVAARWLAAGVFRHEADSRRSQGYAWRRDDLEISAGVGQELVRLGLALEAAGELRATAHGRRLAQEHK